MQSSKILLFGGTFDPFHFGHYQIMHQAQQLINPDKTIVILNQISPHKLTTPPTSYFDRLKMLELALQDEINVEISQVEQTQDKVSYTIDTIKHFKKIYPNSELYLLIGADQYEKFHLWKDYEDILKLVKLVVAKRKGNLVKNTKFDYKPLIITGVEFEVKSSELKLFPKFYLISYLVLNYLNDHGLYALERIKQRMSEHRYQHSLRVAHLAYKLMQQHNPSQAYLAYTAGIYHDIAKEMDYNQQVDIAENILGIKNYDHVKVLHGYIGAYLLRQEYWFTNQLILEAIARHTKPFDYFINPPTILDKVLYLADKLEPNRTNEDVFGQDINDYRELAMKNLDECFEKLYKWLQQNLTQKN